ncbi:MAG: hypothetical protein ACI37Q_02815 [Candidatus Gastranaerophilaceae bacterium]
MTEINPAILQQQGMTQSVISSKPNANPYNLINVVTAEEVGQIAKKEIGNMPYRIATAGYSAPPQGYEDTTKQFLKALDSELGTRSTAFVTSPTADKGSIDAITSEITGLNKGKIFYTTAQDYVEYINPRNFPETINTELYSKLPKHVLPNGAEYSKATAEASNIFVATGGRNATVSDFVNAVKKGNKAIVLNNPVLDVPAWGEAKGRVENASKYLMEQLEAFNNGRKLPHPEVGEFTSEFMLKYKTKLNDLVKIVTLEGTDAKSILNGAKKAVKFIR